MRTKKQIFFEDINNQELNEALRVIRTNLYFLNEEEKSRVILVTSSIPEEGKSTIASNYAMSLAAIGEKVLLVDCNIKKPSIHKKFKLFFDKGLESVLSGEEKVKDVIKKNVEKNLDILPTKNPINEIAKFLLKKKLKIILDEVVGEYNTVILDTPSLMISSDAAIISKYCDGVLYVIGYNQITRKELEFGKMMLDNAKASIYGFIVNKVDKSGVLSGNYRYYNKDYYKKRIGVFEKIFRILK